MQNGHIQTDRQTVQPRWFYSDNTNPAEMFLYKPPLNATNRDRASSVTETNDTKNEIQSSCLAFV